MVLKRQQNHHQIRNDIHRHLFLHYRSDSFLYMGSDKQRVAGMVLHLE